MGLVMDKRIGAQYYTIRNFCKTLEEFDESCKKVSEIRYKVVQLSGIGDFTGAEVKAVLDKYGLTDRFYSARNKYTERELQVCHMSLLCIKHTHPFSCYFCLPAPPTVHRSILINIYSPLIHS